MKKYPYYDPKCDKFPYQKDTGIHYLPLKSDNHVVFDKDYPYIDKSKSFKFKYGLVRIVLFLVVYLVAKIRLGLKIRGRKIYKQHKKEFKNGFISICNHVHMWDFIGVMMALRYRHPRYLAWDRNLNGENATLIRYTGGVPIPKTGLRATAAFNEQIKNYLEKDKGWLHIYPESTMWEYYAKIRPLKKGAFYYAYKCNKPVLPMAFSYRPVGFIRKKIFKQIAKFTLTIGEPIYPDFNLPKEEAIIKMTKEAHAAMIKLANVEDNMYGPIFEEGHERIDYYTDTYGIGYKGSH